MNEATVRELSVLILMARYVVLNDDVYAKWVKWAERELGSPLPAIVSLKESQSFAAEAILEWSAIQQRLKERL
jgi:hypothetical protein